MSDDNKITPGDPLIILPEASKPEVKQHSVILPSTGAKEVLPANSFNAKLQLDDSTLRELGVKSESDLGDDIELERSPIDGACVVSAVVDGVPVCQYCFLPFVIGLPEYAPAEIQVSKANGMEHGIRVKVHGSCQLKHMQAMAKKR